jgi:shikimate dehydrogenase
MLVALEDAHLGVAGLMAGIRLGLIGDNIRRSQSPLLHKLAGRLCGLEVTYEPLVPADLDLDFDAVFDRCREAGFRGINITYPYKERVFRRLGIRDEVVRTLGACNIALFAADGPWGRNTDYSGFKSAFAESLPGVLPGVVAIAGAGGVGKAVAFGLADLGAGALRLFDSDPAKAATLRSALASFAPRLSVQVTPSIEEAVESADGIVNCTPLGMANHLGTAIPRGLITSQRWAFDSVYTPVSTQFLRDAAAAGLATMSGYELFFHQGVDAFRIFTGCEVDQEKLRTALAYAHGTELAAP